MRRLLYISLLLIAACTRNPYPNIDNPNYGGGTMTDQNIIAYIDQRLMEEYYWLDEVEQKSERFNRDVAWENYLKGALSMLETNNDDGYINSKGQRVFYSYIRDITSSTRGSISGFGIGLHYTIALIDSDNNHYGFLVDNVYADSPAAAADVKRGDVITMIDGSYITANNYAVFFNKINGNTASSVRLSLRRQTTGDSYSVELKKAAYEDSPVAHYEVINIDDMKVGYVVYTSFDSEYDNELVAALQSLAAEGVKDVILDLRINSGGAVNSAVTLCSALMPTTFEGATLCSVVRNKRNTKSEQMSAFTLENTGSTLALERLTVIASGYSASASELVIMGLRGLDVPVTLIGSTTEGKNCGMDVTRRTIDGKMVEFAPITFMCFNAKGVGDWGEGITPDIDLTVDSNGLGVSDKNYPIPRADWGDYNHDIALAVALGHVTGKKVSQPTRSYAPIELPVAASVERPMEGIRLYKEGE